MFSIYLAHPISGQTGDAVLNYYDSLIKLLKDKFSVLCPMTGKEYLRTDIKLRAEGFSNPVSTNHAIFERDMWMVNKADLVLVDLTGYKDIVSIGCVMELAVASFLRKHTIVVMEKESIYRHAFVIEASDIIFETIDDALEYLDEFAKQRSDK